MLEAARKGGDEVKGLMDLCGRRMKEEKGRHLMASCGNDD